MLVLLLKSVVKGHVRRGAGGGAVFVRPYTNKVLPRNDQPDLFAPGVAARITAHTPKPQQPSPPPTATIPIAAPPIIVVDMRHDAGVGPRRTAGAETMPRITITSELNAANNTKPVTVENAKRFGVRIEDGGAYASVVWKKMSPPDYAGRQRIVDAQEDEAGFWQVFVMETSENRRNDAYRAWGRAIPMVAHDTHAKTDDFDEAINAAKAIIATQPRA